MVFDYLITIGYSFAQKVPKRTNTIPTEANTKLTELLTHWPEDIAYSDIWDKDVRKTVLERLPSEYSLAERRQEV